MEYRKRMRQSCVNQMVGKKHQNFSGSMNKELKRMATKCTIFHGIQKTNEAELCKSNGW